MTERDAITVDDMEDDGATRRRLRTRGSVAIVVEHGTTDGSRSPLDEIAADIAALVVTTPEILEFVAAESAAGLLQICGRSESPTGWFSRIAGDASEWNRAIDSIDAWDSIDHRDSAAEFARILRTASESSVRDGMISAIASVLTGIPPRELPAGAVVRVRIDRDAGDLGAMADAGALLHTATASMTSPRGHRLAALAAAHAAGIEDAPSFDAWTWEGEPRGSMCRARATMFGLPSYLAELPRSEESETSERRIRECVSGALEASFARNAFLASVIRGSGGSSGVEASSERFVAAVREFLDGVTAIIDGARRPKDADAVRSAAISSMMFASEILALRGSPDVGRYVELLGELREIAEGRISVDGIRLIREAIRVVAPEIRSAVDASNASRSNGMLDAIHGLSAQILKIVPASDSETVALRRRLRALASLAKESMSIHLR
jgi:hypothetical protein